MGSNRSSQQRKEGAGKVRVPARGPTALECVSLCPASCVPSLLATLAQASPLRLFPHEQHLEHREEWGHADSGARSCPFLAER